MEASEDAQAIAAALDNLTNAIHDATQHNGGKGEISIAASLFEIPYQWMETNRQFARIATALEKLAGIDS